MQGLQPFGVGLAHSPQVAAEVALGQEVEHDQLLEHRGVPGRDRLQGGDAVDECLGQHEIAETQSGKEHLVERPDVDHAAMTIESVQRRHRTAAVAIFAVVVVLDQHGRGAPGPVEEGQATLEAHRHAEGTLVGGREIDQPRRRVGGGRHHRPVGVDADRHHRGAGGGEDRRGARIARVFDPRTIAGIEQEPADEVEGLLRPRDDHDVLP